MHSSFVLQGIVLSVALASAFNPYTQPDISVSSSEWKPVSSGNNEGKRDLKEFHSLNLRRAAHSDENLHPELQNVQAANRVTKKYRRRGIPGPDVDGALAIRDVHSSLRRRGLLRDRQTLPDIVIGGDPTATQATVVPAGTPVTPDSLGISQDGNDFSYFSQVDFGPQNKSFLLVIDTGSSDTWIPSSACRTQACAVHNTYGSSDSTTLQITRNSFQIQYGSGEARGVVGNDTIKFAGFEINAYFGLATSVSDDFIGFPIDGIMGLGFNTASQQEVPTIMDELVDGGFIQQKLFGVALSRNSDGFNDGVINFGGIDSGLFDGNLSFSNSVSDAGLWEVLLDDAGVDGEGLDLTGRSAVIDTGTSLILIPPRDAFSLHSLIPGAETNGEMFAVPCNSTSNLEFTINGITYVVPPEDYIGSAIYPNSDLCISLVTARQILNANVWLLGDVFLKNVYSVFDLDNNRLGFAPRRSREQVANPPSSTGVLEDSPSRTLEAAPSPTVDQSAPNDLATLISPSPSGSRIGNASPFNSGSNTLPSPSQNSAWLAPLLLIIGIIAYL